MQPFTGQSGADPGDVNFSSFLIKLVAAAWTELSYDPDQILASLTSYALTDICGSPADD